jgi:hypothetical protein
VHELHQWPAVPHAPQSAPVSVIAEIRSGIARQTGGQGGSLQRVDEAREGRISFPCGLASFDRGALRAMAVHIRKQNRARIARAHLDANLPALAGESEDHQHVRL